MVELSPHSNAPFRSYWLGGFEGSSQRRNDGRRLDLIATTGHDRFADQDYRRLRQAGLLTARDAVRWHLAEPEAGRYDWSELLPRLRAARRHG
ncbi:MAG: beta-glucosidase, partial [Acidobacteriota bacterium]|nr:beta-glucosidase [Acidobacteriota bacterium]